MTYRRHTETTDEPCKRCGERLLIAYGSPRPNTLPNVYASKACAPCARKDKASGKPVQGVEVMQWPELHEWDKTQKTTPHSCTFCGAPVLVIKKELLQGEVIRECGKEKRMFDTITYDAVPLDWEWVEHRCDSIEVRRRK